MKFDAGAHFVVRAVVGAAPKYGEPSPSSSWKEYVCVFRKRIHATMLFVL